MDISERCLTDGVYEASFDFGPALKGMMLIPHDTDALEVYSKLMDTIDKHGPDPEYRADMTTGEAWLQDFMCAMKRLSQAPKNEARYNPHKLSQERRRARETTRTPTR